MTTSLAVLRNASKKHGTIHLKVGRCFASSATPQAQLYARAAHMQREMGSEFLAAARTPTKMYDRILDFGCGTCPLAGELLKLLSPGGRLVCADPDASRLVVAKDLWSSELASSQMVLLEASDSTVAQALSSGQGVGDPHFDLIFLNFVMHWIEHKVDLFREFRSVLQPGAHVMIQSPSAWPALHLKVTQLMSDKARQEQLFGRLHIAGLEETATAAEDAGLEVVSRENLEIPHSYATYNSISEFLDWWRATTHGIVDPAHIPESKLRELHRDHDGQVVAHEHVFRLIVRRPC